MLVWLSVLCGLAFGANHAGQYNAWCWESKPCTESNQCKQENGLTGVCCLGKCRSVKLGRGELCGASLKDTTCPSCDDRLACVDTGGSVFRCEQQDILNGCPCVANVSKNCISTQPCLPSGVCGPSLVALNGRCEVGSQCYPQAICNGTCQAIPDGKGCPPGTPNICLPTSACFKNGNCAPILQIGASCQEDYECAPPNLYCAPSKTCTTRANFGANCSGISPLACVSPNLCQGTCVAPRSMADNSDCTLADACVSGICTGGKCTRTHFVQAGGDCTADLDCPFGASCSSTKKCTVSGLDEMCDPTLGGTNADRQCQGSNDLYCSCAGRCVATDESISPVGSSTSECQAAKNSLAISGYKLDELRKIDITSLTLAQKNRSRDLRMLQRVQQRKAR
jgi:hypothetical protein